MPMRLPHVPRYAFVWFALAASATLGACSAGSGGPNPPEPSIAGAQGPFRAARNGLHAHPDLVKTWMHTDAKTLRLLYASDFSNNVVLVYDYPAGTPAGTLTGFSNPQGLCADGGDHNVFVTNTGGENVLEYAWGATSPKATYGDSNEFPVACSVDPSTGRLAVADIFSPTTGIGAVTICSQPSRCRVYVEPAGLESISAVAYLPNGDLYAAGTGSQGQLAGAYLAAGSRTWTPVAFRASIGFLGAMQWDGKYLAIGDQQGPSGNTVIDRCSASGPNVSCNGGKVDLNSSGDVVQFFIKYGDRGVVGADAASGGIGTWAYPQGGEPRKVIQGRGKYPLYVGMAVLRQP